MPPRERGDDDVSDGVVRGEVNAHTDITDKYQRTDIGAGQVVLRITSRQASISSSILWETGKRWKFCGTGGGAHVAR